MRQNLPASLILIGALIVPSGPASAQADKQPKFYKPGATMEEFQRTRAACIVQAEMAAADSWLLVYSACMRSQGWVIRYF